ncbi:MAG: type II toxin-antitoxin system VapC family toxin [Acidobacteria bacterium]|nr:type II toxin-antitoxin system VapC family toxin [Acidobacteriota bacterium]
MNKFVLDASVVLAFLNREPGFETIAALLEEAAISAVNVAEAATKLADKGANRIQETIRELKLEIMDFDEHLAYRAAALRRATRKTGLSLGDRACLATAQKLGVPAVTADRKWAQLRLDVEIQVVR